jgi:hypothetical protein
MKECPRCRRKYSDEWSYCLDDGTPLSAGYDSETTIPSSKPGSHRDLPPTIAAPYQPPVAHQSFGTPVQENSRQVFAYLIGGVLALLLIGAGVAVLLLSRPKPGSDASVVPSTSPQPNPTSKNPDSTPELKPTPTMDLVAVNKPRLMSAIRLADQAEAEAERALDPRPLYNSYQGEALKSELARVNDLKSKGIYQVEVLEDQRFEKFNVTPDGNHADVRVTETWSTANYSASNGECLNKTPSHKVPQTIYLEHGSNGWLVDSIDFDKTEPVKPVPCESRAP